MLTTGTDGTASPNSNTPVPHAVYFFLIVTFAFSLVYWVLMPAWPLGRTYTKGSEADQRKLSRLAGNKERLTPSQQSRESFAQIQADPGLMNVIAPDGQLFSATIAPPVTTATPKGQKGFQT